MKKLLPMSVLMLFVCLSFNLDFKIEKTSMLPEISFSKVYAQDAAVEAKNEVKDVDVKVSAAVDMESHSIEVPAMLAPVLTFLQGIPKVGPVLVKGLTYMGLVAALLTLLSTLLMSLSGFMAVLSKGKASPKWLKTTKKYMDYATVYAKYLSMFNAPKKGDEKKKT